MRRIDLETWPRREQYRFFRPFEQPFFSICTDVELGSFRSTVKAAGAPFFLSLLHAAMTAFHDVPAFRLRLDETGVIEHDRIHCAVTVLGTNEVFRFCWLEFDPDRAVFVANGRRHMTEASTATGALEPHAARTDVIHVSSLPWFRFTGMMHPRRCGGYDSVPKLVFGKVFERDGTEWLPLALEAHHALADGIHVARFLEALQERLAHVAVDGAGGVAA
jgi:chloramphenicol O-acetyltransferase type A